LGNEYIVYFDHYVNPQHYGAVKSTDLKHWQDISADVSFPRGSRHGTISFAPENLVKNLSLLNNSTTTKTQQ
jgi:hypothetical protein